MLIIYYLISFILGYLVYQHIGRGFIVGAPNDDSCIFVHDQKCDDPSRIQGIPYSWIGTGRCKVGTDKTDCDDARKAQENTEGMTANKQMWACAIAAGIVYSGIKLYDAATRRTDDIQDLIDVDLPTHQIENPVTIVDGTPLEPGQDPPSSHVPGGIVDHDP